jgi:hypothetical protein
MPEPPGGGVPSWAWGVLGLIAVGLAYAGYSSMSAPPAQQQQMKRKPRKPARPAKAPEGAPAEGAEQ